jgi:hypothetical protein
LQIYRAFAGGRIIFGFGFQVVVTNPLGTELLSALHAIIRDGVLVEIGDFPSRILSNGTKSWVQLK